MKGFKNTELGLTPEDWEVVQLSYVSNIINGDRGYNYPQGKDIVASGIPFINAGHLQNGKVVFSSMHYITSEKYHSMGGVKIEELDVLVCLRGSLGKFALVVFSEGTVASSLCVVRCNKKIISPWLLSQFFNFSQFTTFIEEANNGSSQPNLSATSLKGFRFALPKNSEEQGRIAQVLSDIDSLIETIDKKIAKKRTIKDGVMQKLLSPKSHWKINRLGEICEITMGQSPSSLTYNEEGHGFILIQGNADISNRRITKRIWTTMPTKYSGENAIIMTVRAPVGYVAMSFENCCLGRGVCALNNGNINKWFLYYLLIFNESKWCVLEQGSTFTSANSKQIYEFEISYPDDITEQFNTGNIIHDMDDEIEQLEKERAKYTGLKQGAMQKLLTGEIRLVKAAAQPQKSAEIRTIPVSAHIVGGHIVKRLYNSKGWGRTKLQKSLHLVGYCCQLDFGNEYIRNTAGPDDQKLMNHIDSKFKQYRQVDIETTTDNNGRKHYNYIPTSMIDEVEQAFENYPAETQKAANDLLAKIWKMDLARAEIVSTLYAVWNNRIIKKQRINNTLLLEDFYDWSEHKADFSQDLVLRALSYMNKEGIIPLGWGKYIDKK